MDRLRSITLGLSLTLLGIDQASAYALENRVVQTGDGNRSYVLATPSATPESPRPLVLVLHGHIGTAANALGGGKTPSPLSAWLPIVDRESVNVAALQGLIGRDGRTGWHDARRDATENPISDDIGFAQRVVDELVKSGRADPHRIYVMGMSNGAMMSYSLALAMRPVPAAIATVAGTMARDSTVDASKPPKLSVLLIHGVADPIVPFAGGAVGVLGRKTGTVTGVAATRDYWLAADGLPSKPSLVQTFPHHDASGSTRATKTVYGEPGGLQVEVIAVDGGGHVEPSLRYHYGWLYRQLVGRQNQDFESAEEAWAFFSDKQRE